MKALADALALLKRQRSELDAVIADLQGLIGAIDGASTRALNGRWTQDDDATLLRMEAAGMSHRDIATSLGRTTQSVSQRLCRIRRGARC